MATNIVKEDNLIKVKQHSTVLQYDTLIKTDLMSKTDTDLVVVFKDKDGEYPDGKIVLSNEFVEKYDYDYIRDGEGNVLSCKVTKKFIKNGQSTDFDKISTTSYYDEKGRLIKKEYSDRNGVVFNREQYWYYANGTIERKKVKSTHTITTTEYRPDGKVSLVWTQTIKSGFRQKQYYAVYDSQGNLIYYRDHSKGIEVHIEIDKDHNGNILSETEIFRHIVDKRVFAKTTKIYDPANEYKISKVIKNGYLVEQYWYNLNSEVIKMMIKDEHGEVITTIQRTIDPETNEKTIEKHIYKNAIHSKYIKEVFDEQDNLLTYAEDNSKVTTYTYTEDNKRETAITKQLVDGEFIVIDEINYEYDIDPDTSYGIKTRTEKRYDKNGNVIHKQIHKENTTELRQEYTVENRFYEVPEEP